MKVQKDHLDHPVGHTHHQPAFSPTSATVFSGAHRLTRQHQIHPSTSNKLAKLCLLGNCGVPEGNAAPEVGGLE